MNGALVRVYSLKEDGNKNVSKNFKVKEFRCQDGSDPVFIGEELLDVLQDLRDFYKAPVNIEDHSAYRTPSHNKKVEGSSSNSRHMYAVAADLHVVGVSHKEVYNYLNKKYPNKYGIGLYSWGVHVDTRKEKSRWNG